jgi:hypothetical protein
MNLSALNGIFEKIGVGLTMSRRITDPPIQIMISLVAGIATMIYGEYMIATRLGAAYTPIPLIVCFIYYQFVVLATPPADTMKFLEFKDKKLQDRWGKRKIPMHLLVEEFLADNIAFKGDVYELLSKLPAWTTTPVGL